jgi:hypothetical protein
MRRVSVTALLALALFAAPAGAESTIIGLPDPVAASSGGGIGCQCSVVQTAVPAGDLATAPADGRIGGWWAIETLGTGGADMTAELRVFQPLLVGLRALGRSETESLTLTKVEFPASVPVSTGEYLGLDINGPAPLSNPNIPNPPTYYVSASFSSPGSSLTEFGTQLGAKPLPGMPYSNAQLEFGAQFYYQPALASLGTHSGSTQGGTSVVITGSHLTDSTSVAFGSTSAQHFHIDSNTQITATAPAHAAGAVDVTVSGPGGASPTLTADSFTYVQPKASLSAAAIDFGAVPVGTASPPRPETVSNTGTVPLAIASTSLSGSPDFSLSSDGCAGKTLGPGASCTVQIAFKPSSGGAREATLKLADNSADGPHTIAIAGSGAASGVAGSGASATAAFVVGRLKGLTLPVAVEARGTVRVTDTARHTQIYTSTASGGPGTIRVKLRPRRRHRTFTVHARVTFTPKGGKAQSVTVTLRIRS